MLVMVLNEQVIAPKTVCQTCLLADQSGQPRWSSGNLRCGRALGRLTENKLTENKLPENKFAPSKLTGQTSDPTPELANQFQCAMGFRVVNIP